MPRKFWQQKNRYCWNSNLNEATFLFMLRLYCRGHSCSKTGRIFRRHAERFGVEAVSRQTINRYYLLFGDYLYALLPEEYRFAELELDEGKNGEGEGAYPEHYNTQLILMALYQALYGKLDWRDRINKTLIGNKTQEIYKILVGQSKSKKGIPLKTFCAHFAFCMWHCFIPAIRPGEPTGKALYELLKETMEEYPIGTFELASLRIVSNA